MGPSAAVLHETPETVVAAVEFASLIEKLGPFERSPSVAVAVSGGADSMALALLARDWALSCGGSLTALIVDHGLRPESDAEAATVAGWLAARGVPAMVLRWEGEKPSSGIQEAAREARYRLLSRWCAAAGVLHLLLGHHRDDQIETVLLRAARGSGPDGLAGMSAIVELAGCRLIRPLLAVSRDRLRATLRARGQGWIEDPSNQNPAFARVRLRRDLMQRPQPASDAAARARVLAEAAVARLLAASVAIYPEGWAVIQAEPWRGAPGLARRALTRVLVTVGGAAYPPRGDRLDAVLAEVLAGLPAARTLAGCRLIPDGQAVLVVREAGRSRVSPAVAAGRVVWDRRFAVALAGVAPEGGRVAALGEAGWREVVANQPELRAKSLPFPALMALPALFDLEGVRAVPHLMYGRRGADPDSLRGVSAMFRPSHALAGPGFVLS